MARGEVPDGGGGCGGGGAGRDRGRQGPRRHLQAQPQWPRVRQPLPRHERDHPPLLPPRGPGLPAFLSPSSLFVIYSVYRGIDGWGYQIGVLCPSRFGHGTTQYRLVYRHLKSEYCIFRSETLMVGPQRRDIYSVLDIGYSELGVFV